MTAQNVYGNLQFQSGDGNVEATAVRGTVRMHTGDGNMTGTGFDGSLEASTGDGNAGSKGASILSFEILQREDCPHGQPRLQSRFELEYLFVLTATSRCGFSAI